MRFDIDMLTLDARPSTLPDRAPRCLEDELLPDVQPLPPPKASERWVDTSPKGRAWRLERDRKDKRAAYARKREARDAGPVEPMQLEGMCAACLVRPAEASGRCTRRRCRD